MLDRIDLFVTVARPREVIVPGAEPGGESSAEVRKRVVAAHRIQIGRQGRSNARLAAADVQTRCRLGPAERSFFERAAEQLRLSPRGCQRVLKVARTIADLEGARSIGAAHLAEAVTYREVDRSRNLR